MLIVSTVAATLHGFLLPYARHFRNMGWRVDGMASGATHDPVVLGSFDAAFELGLSRSVKDVRGMLIAFRRLRDRMASGYDIVHVHTPLAAFLTRAAVLAVPRGRRPAVVYTAHGFHFHSGGPWVTNQVFLLAERVAGRFTDRLVVINDEDRAAARRVRIVPAHHLVQMPGIGVDTGWFAPWAVDPERAAEVRTQIGLPPDTSVFVVIGELNRNKRPWDPVKALAAMRTKGAHLVFLGDGRGRTELEALARRLGLEPSVHLLGRVSDVRPYVAIASAVILASRREGLPRSIMEALSMEVPVITSAARGSRDLVRDDAGRVVPVGDPAAMAEAMDWMLADPDRARALGRRGRERMVAEYDERGLIGAHERLYEGILRERGQRSAARLGR